jgi:hypothetical protein
MLLALLAAHAAAAPAPEAEAAPTTAMSAMCADGAGIVGVAGLVSSTTGNFYALSLTCADSAAAAAADPAAASAIVLLPAPESTPADAVTFDSGAACDIANAVVGYSAAQPAAVTKIIAASVADQEGESACSFGAGVDGDSEARVSLACGGVKLAGLSAEVAAPAAGAPFIASLTIVCPQARAASAVRDRQRLR